MKGQPLVAMRPMAILRFTFRSLRSLLERAFSCRSQPFTVSATAFSQIFGSITDVLGHQFINAQLIADQFAENGYVRKTKFMENDCGSVVR